MRLIHVTSKDQLAQCLDIRQEVFVVEQQVPADLEIDEYDAFPLVCDHIAVESDGKVVGTARMKEFEEDTAKMQRIAVLKPYRTRGVGSLLLQGLEDLARARGYEYAVLDSQCRAQDFYRKAGYEVISDEPFDDAGIPHVRMKKTL